MEFRDLKKQYQVLKPEMDAAIGQVLEESVYIGGNPVAQLEAELAEYVDILLLHLQKLALLFLLWAFYSLWMNSRLRRL